ncbi:hypothetical protein SAMN05216326_11860 [Nitrosomonas marina]|uniref:TubC N-terminal docking domain-containing protein n=1 Tax=Nitrosomonas marina TaxID=917 RepID=A0A1I0D6N3_9PROT|nr:hypothetical protein [Nitrosomonas marina]SET27865.1 hypothetical protein SAMN05216326_11860 [Nitrosomonas marina]
MEAIEIIEYLRSNDFTVKADGDFIELSPPEKVTEELINRLRKNKPEILAALKVEERRQKVLSMLEKNPDTLRVYITDEEADLNNVILTIAIRDLASFEMLIPKSKYDPFMLIDFINKNDQ